MSNDYFNASGQPGTGSAGTSAAIRAEFLRLQEAFDKLPSITGNLGKLLTVGLTGIEATSTFGGNAATATALQNPRTINGVSFNGTANIVVADSTKAPLTGAGTSGTWGISVTGNAGTATALQTARLINGVSFNGTADITIADSTKVPLNGFGASGTWGISITGNAVTATNVAWSGVTGKPTGVSAFTNDAGYLTSVSAGSLTGGTLAPGVTASSLTSVGTLGALSVTGTVTAGGFTGNLTGNASTATTASSMPWTGLTGTPMAGGIEVGYRRLPVGSVSSGSFVAADSGKCIYATGGVTAIANGGVVQGDAITIYNNTAGNITITQAGALTMRQAGTANTGNRTLAQRGLATIVYLSGTEAVISGSGLT